MDSVGLTSTACLNGTKYSEGMFVSFGLTSGLPDFGKIMKLLIVAQKAKLQKATIKGTVLVISQTIR